MRETHLKSLVISALRSDPDLSRLQVLRDATGAQHRQLLRWLDQSGLALYFLDRLRQLNAADQLPESFRHQLESRLAANRDRSGDMLDEFRRITNSFTDTSVSFCALKGFSLVPDFCPARHLRHQSDFDFLVSPKSVSQAKLALESLGYAEREVKPSGEVTFSTPQTNIPSAADDIYARQRHREVDLLPSLNLGFHGVSVHIPTDPLVRGRTNTVETLSFPALETDDLFSLQVLHAFSHVLGSWIRLSWLLEIARFLDIHSHHESLWLSLIQRQQSSAALSPDVVNNRNAFGLILSLTQEVFRSSRTLPSALQDWCIQPLPVPIQAWVRHFGRRFAQADLDGSKLSLFLHREFVEIDTAASRRAWRRYALGRLLPFGHRSSIGKVSIASPSARLRANVSQRLHSTRRALFHLRELVSFPVEAIRWKRALRAFQRQRARILPQSDSLRASSGTPTGSALTNLARFPD